VTRLPSVVAPRNATHADVKDLFHCVRSFCDFTFFGIRSVAGPEPHKRQQKYYQGSCASQRCGYPATHSRVAVGILSASSFPDSSQSYLPALVFRFLATRHGFEYCCKYAPSELVAICLKAPIATEVPELAALFPLTDRLLIKQIHRCAARQACKRPRSSWAPIERACDSP
jgi:hypothetical protein